jgi:hypothetical protein
VIEIKHPGPLPANQPLQDRLSLNERQWSEISPIQVKEVKRDEDALAFPEKQSAEIRPAVFIEATNLTIEYGAFNPKVLGDPRRKLGKSAECVAVPGDEFAFSALDISESAEAVDL